MRVRFVIIGAPRTGSTLLVKTLNALDGIRCHGELLGINRVRGYEDGFDPAASTVDEREARLARLAAIRESDPVDFIRTALDGAEPARGFKALYGSLEHAPFGAVLDYLLASPDLRFIHLWRDNALRRYISERRMLAGGPSNSLTAPQVAGDLRVTVSIDEFEREAALVESQAARLRDLLSDRPLLELRYEDLAGDTAGTVAQTCAFLGIDRAADKIHPALDKVGPADLAEAVTNLDELLAHPATRRFVQVG